jgi:hypothetical protein
VQVLDGRFHEQPRQGLVILPQQKLYEAHL